VKGGEGWCELCWGGGGRGSAEFCILLVSHQSLQRVECRRVSTQPRAQEGRLRWLGAGWPNGVIERQELIRVNGLGGLVESCLVGASGQEGGRATSTCAVCCTVSEWEVRLHSWHGGELHGYLWQGWGSWRVRCGCAWKLVPRHGTSRQTKTAQHLDWDAEHYISGPPWLPHTRLSGSFPKRNAGRILCVRLSTYVAPPTRQR